MTQHNAPLTCFHCGEPVLTGSRFKVRIFGADQPMCCAGCEAVAQAIVDAGATAYYEQRSVEALEPGTLEELAPWAHLLEDPAFVQRHVQFRNVGNEADEPEADRLTDPACAAPGLLAETRLAIEGLRCGACAWLIEKVLLAMPGVVFARANASTARLHLGWRPSQTSLAALCGRLLQVGYAALPIGSTELEERRRKEEARAGRRLFVAGLIAAQVMMLATPEYVAADELDHQTILLLRGAALLLTLPALVYAGAGFYQSAWRALQQRRLNMDVPISLGLSLAFLGSLAGLITGAEAVYFESVSMFLFFVLGARQIESRIRKRALAQRERLALAPPALAHRMAPEPGEIPPWRLSVGDEIRIPSGERLPADARLLSPEADLDLSSLTGELHPARRSTGELCPEGAVNLGREIVARVEEDPANGSLARLSALAEEAAALRPQWAVWAERIAARFTLGILILASLLLGWGLLSGEGLQDWLPRLVAVLVVSCPCALSVAGPAAYSAALARLLEQGVVISRPDALEAAWQLTDVVFDKTGTLTQPDQSSVRWETLVPGQEPPWPLLAALCAESHHPLARALLKTAQQHAGPPTDWPRLLDRQARAGLGMEARTEAGQHLLLGSALFVGFSGQDHQANLYFAMDGQPISVFWLDDQPRPEAAEVVARLKAMGLRLHLLSGDLPARAERLGARLGFLPEQTHGGLSPAQKQASLKALQDPSRRVAMVGDGHNDAAVLAQADLSVAMAGSAPLAQQRADCYLLSDGLEGLLRLIKLAGRTRTILRQNQAWAIGYNLVAIPLAMAGFITPLWAALGMAASSLMVMLNAARLYR